MYKRSNNNRKSLNLSSAEVDSGAEAETETIKDVDELLNSSFLDETGYYKK
jgi:hypothetical protein